MRNKFRKRKKAISRLESIPENSHLFCRPVDMPLLKKNQYLMTHTDYYSCETHPLIMEKSNSSKCIYYINRTYVPSTKSPPDAANNLRTSLRQGTSKIPVFYKLVAQSTSTSSYTSRKTEKTDSSYLQTKLRRNKTSNEEVMHSYKQSNIHALRAALRGSVTKPSREPSKSQDNIIYSSRESHVRKKFTDDSSRHRENSPTSEEQFQLTLTPKSEVSRLNIHLTCFYNSC